MAHELLKALHAEHEEVMDMIKKLHKAKSERERTMHLRHVREMLIPHMRGEEEIVYAALEQEDGEAREHALVAKEEHQAARHILDQLGAMQAGDERFKAKAEVFKDMIKNHVEKEEAELFDDLEDIYSDQELDRLVERYMTVRESSKSSTR